MKRRNFIRSGCSVLALTMLETHFLQAGCYLNNPKKNPASAPLIHSLQLLTATSPADMKKFYAGLIGLPVIEESPGHIIFKAGSSNLGFIMTEPKDSRPFYHFAFNIPENKIIKAYEWQKQKTPIIFPRPGMQPGTDTSMPSDIVHFTNWNAHSIFFLDPAGNLLEYIARHNLDNAANGNFSAKDILCLSEIGLITENVHEQAATVKTKLGLQQYRNGDENFQAIGDENGLLLNIKKGIIWSGHPGQENKTGIFKTAVQLNTTSGSTFKIEDYPYEIRTNK